jgi:nicotinate phosphoribosyltransferase
MDAVRQDPNEGSPIPQGPAANEWVDDRNVSLLTDLYELTMAASYHNHDMNRRATFDLFIRELPKRRNFLVACGLEQALHYLENLRFTDDSLEYLDGLGLFRTEFLSFLSHLSFTGEVWAMAEGELVFAGEPLLSVTAPLIEAQIVETFLLNCMTYQTMVASKAARVMLACEKRRFVDMSPRRDHAADAAIKAARAAYIAGAAATSNVLAGRLYGIPLSGTMAHSYVMAFEDEIAAFRAFVSDFPNNAVLLIDTFDVEEGAQRAVQVAREAARRGAKVSGVRIDSGELAPLSRKVRRILDEAGMHDVEIILSGDLDEYRIKALLQERVPVDAFGVGTQLGTSADAPTLGGVYKLVADSDGPKIKLSTRKATWPGCKQVYRIERDGLFDRDVVALQEEPMVGGRGLLSKVMDEGERTGKPGTAQEARIRCRRSLDHLPPRLRRLGEPAEPYRVSQSPGLFELTERVRRQSR